MSIGGKTSARLRRQLSGWSQLKRRSAKIASELTLDISELSQLFDQRIGSLSQQLKLAETVWTTNPAQCVLALESYKSMPDNFITARHLLEWSQTELARRCGMHAEAIYRYEKMKYRTITLAKAIAIAEVLSAGFRERGYQRDPDAQLTD